MWSEGARAQSARLGSPYLVSRIDFCLRTVRTVSGKTFNFTVDCSDPQQQPKVEGRMHAKIIAFLSLYSIYISLVDSIPNLVRMK